MRWKDGVRRDMERPGRTREGKRWFVQSTMETTDEKTDPAILLGLTLTPYEWDEGHEQHDVTGVMGQLLQESSTSSQRQL